VQLPVRETLPERRPSRHLSAVADFKEPLKALTAAGMRANRKRAGYMRRLIQPWQARAMSYYDLVGECWNAAQFYSRSLKQVRIYAATRDVDGELTDEGVPENVKEMVARIQDPGGGGYSRLMDAYGRIMFLIGEGYFLITNPDDEEESWEFVSPDELRLTGDGAYTRFAAPSLPAEEFVDVPDSAYQPVGDEALIFRVWRPSPRYSLLADSPIRAVLDILEELVLLTLAVRSTAKNRLVRNGILYVPDEISPVSLGTEGDEDMSLDPFIANIQEQLVAGVQNPGTAAAVSPALVRGPAEYVDAMKWIQVSNPLETYPEEGLRNEAIRRFATGIEMPAEILLGTADVNHWGAWLIDEQAAKNYIFPACQAFCDDLTAVFLRPALRQAGVSNWNDYVIAYDASVVVAKPDRTDSWKDAHDRLVISDASYREAIDANEQDAPDANEWDRRAAVKMNDPDALVIPYSTGGPDRADDQESGQVGGPEVDADDPTGDGAPERPTTPPAEGLAIKRGAVLGAVQAALVRARKQAGSRLRVRIRNMTADQFTQSLIPFDDLPTVPDHRLAEVLGPEWVTMHAGGPGALVRGRLEELRETLASFGVNGDIADKLERDVQVFAARGLCSAPKRGVPNQIVAYIERAVQ
jgi:hypothetical protein